MTPMAASLIAPKFSSLIQPVGTFVFIDKVYIWKTTKSCVVPLLAILLMMKDLGKGIRRA